MGVGGPVTGGGFGPGRVGSGGGGLPGQGPVRAFGVAGAGEGAGQGLQLGDRGGLGLLGAEPFLGGLLEPLDFALGLGWFGFPFFWMIPRRRSSVSRPLRPPLPPEKRVVNTIPLSVSVEAGAP